MHPLSMSQKPLDLSKGTVIHIEDFKSPGYAPKDKYLVIFGSESITDVLAFTLTSQDWTKTANGREVIEIPQGTLSKLPKKCWIKCFHHFIRLDVQQLEQGYKNYTVSIKGKLPPEFLNKIKNVVECSDVLSKMDIEDCLESMKQDHHEKKAK